jgi:2'-phosphotransferase
MGVPIGADGYCAVDDVLRVVNVPGVTIDDVKEVVRTNDKQRFTLLERDGRLMIRANQGHSIPLVRDEELLTPITDAAVRLPVL